MKRIGTIIIGVIFCALGIWLCVWGFNKLSTALQSTSWPTVNGKVISSEVKVELSGGSGTRGGSSSNRYFAEISYSYTINNNIFTSNNFSYGRFGSKNKKDARRIAKQYQRGKTVKVYYNPKQPEQAVLKPGATFASYLPISFGIIWTLVSCAILKAGIKPKIKATGQS